MPSRGPVALHWPQIKSANPIVFSAYGVRVCVDVSEPHLVPAVKDYLPAQRQDLGTGNVDFRYSLDCRRDVDNGSGNRICSKLAGFEN